MLSFSPCSLSPALFYASLILLAIEPESGAEISQLHFIVYALLFLAFGSLIDPLLSLP
jgi:hypothetical protein